MPDKQVGVRALLLSLTLSSLGLGISLPIVALFAVELGAGGLLIGLILALRWLSRLITDVPAGILSERLGRRRLYVLGTALAALSGVMSATAPDPGWLAVARIVEGIGAGMAATVSLALVADLSSKANRGRMLGQYQAAHRIGLWFGPAIGGVLAVSLDLRAALWVYAILAALAILPALFVRERAPDVSTVEVFSARESLAALFRSRDMLLISAVGFAIFFTMTGAQFTVLPLFAIGEFGLGADVVGWLMFGINTVGFLLLYPTGLLSDRGYRRGVVVVLAASAGLGLLVLAAATNALALWLAAVLLAGGAALRGPATQAYAMDAGGRGSHGTTAGVFRAVGDAGSTAGPVVAGLLLAFGPRAFFLVNAVLLLMVAGAFFRWASQRPGIPESVAALQRPAIGATR